MKTKTKFLGFLAILLTFCFSSFTVNAQIHEKLEQEGNYTFKQIKNLSEKHFDKIGRGKGVGYKQYQRWKYWAERNLDDNGKVRNSLDALQSYKKFSKESKSIQNKSTGYAKTAAARNFSSNYIELGPLTSTYTSTWSSGLGRVSAIGLDPNNDNHIIVGSPTGGIWKTTNLGSNWTPLFDDQANIDVYALEISHSNSNYYWAGLNGGMVRSTDGGNSWTNVSGVANDLYNTITMHPNNANIIFAIGQWGERVYRSTDGGASFSVVADVSLDLYDLEFHPTNPEIIYASGNNIVLISTNGGTSFTTITSGPWSGNSNILMMAVTPAAPNNLYVLQEQNGGFNALYLSQDMGNTWNTLDTFDGTNNIMGYDQNVQSGQAPRDMDIVVSPVDANIVHVAGVETWRTNNLGQSWTKTTRWSAPGASDFIHADIDLLIYDGNRIVAGTDGGIYYSTDEANNWTDISAGLAIRQFYRIGASRTDIDRVSGGSQDNGTGTLVSGTWRDWLGADGMETFIDWNNPNIIYGTSQNGTFYKSLDGGNSTTSIDNSPPNGNWVTPFEQDPINPSTIYAAADQVYKSTNGGGSWSTISNFSNGNADEMKISPADPNYIYVSYGTTLFTTTNGGSSWVTRSIPAGSRINYITVHPTDASRLAIAVSGSSNKIHESMDGGATWSNITGNIPSSVSIECVLYDVGDSGLYAGGNPGIYYTSDTSAPSYNDVTLNLPKVRVTEFEIQNQILYVATYGRGLWKYDLGCDGSLAGQACNDFDACTENDIYDANCDCVGSPVADSDNDGVCDTLDQCPGFDDTVDIDQDGIPDGCDTSIDCSSCDTVVSDFPSVEDFETGTNNICQFGSDDLDWVVLSGATPSSNTGPTSAYSGSNYFYVEASDPNFPTKVATFKGSCFDVQSASTASINFWYHMYGGSVNELKLNISTDGGASYTTVWTQTGNKGDVWLNVNVDLTDYISSQLSYAFTATTGTNWDSDIAVDLITVDAIFDACASNGGDVDGDGICADVDCDDNDVNIGSEGMTCDDGDDCTENDVLDADCNCAGTPIETDTDGDGVFDCNDQEINSPCPLDVDINGVSNDDDADGLPNCTDSCDDRIDTDGDGTPDCIDNCPNDVNKTEPGDCGCGVSDIDTDGDGVLDCNDLEINSPCPLDVNANGVSNDDDNDGTPNCNDACNDNADTDSDGTPDCLDNCPNDANKTEPGDCGCGNLEVDTDNDGILDCDDNEINSPCPLDVDANGVSNDDDHDGIANCIDDCDNRIDTDGDGTPDCIDNCENDPNKTEPGDCGCGIADDDTDGDGILDCNDAEKNSPCPLDVDSNGVSNDNDGDGIANCNDICPSGDDNLDSDGDGTPDACDCTTINTSFSSNTLSHQGPGSASTTLNLSGGIHKDASFTISELNARTSGKPNSRFVEQITVNYLNGNGQNIAYGTYSGDLTNSVNVSITGEVQSISIVLQDALGGSSNSNMSVTLGSVNTCIILDCIDSDGDGICNSEDQCPDFNDNLIGTACDDEDPCTINDVYGNDCSCSGTYADTDGDGVCDGDDICPGGDDNVDLNGNGVPDDCDCTLENGNFSPSTLSSSGSSNTIFAFPNPSKDVTFSISGLDAQLNGNPRNRYEDVVSVAYTLISGGTQTVTYRGGNTNVASVNIGTYITSITVTLSNGVSGSSASLSVNLSSIDYCAQNITAPAVYAPEAESDFGLNPEEIGLKIYPNPANTEVNILFTSPNNGNYSIEVKSILGQTVYKAESIGTGSKPNTTLSASNWQAGMYFIIVSLENKSFVEKVVIQH